jgi:AcrR family transcriptional regulator
MPASSPGLAAPRSPVAIDDALVQAALRAADQRGVAVADVPVIAIAQEAGLSRSTLLRRLGGSRAALDEAVRFAGVDPGGRLPVRIRALDAAAALIAESGLAAATLEAVAERAGCSVHSIYTAFGGRDELLRIMFERHSPIPDLEEILGDATDDLITVVRRLYQVLAEALYRQPRVFPAMIAEIFSRPASPTVHTLMTHGAPRTFAVLGDWLSAQIRAGAVRDLPVFLLIHQLLAPMTVHLLVRPTYGALPAVDVPDLDTACSVLADAFVRAVATAPADPKST